MKRKTPEGVDQAICFDNVSMYVLNVSKSTGEPTWKRPMYVEGPVHLKFSKLQNSFRVYSSADSTDATHELQLSKIDTFMQGPERSYQVSFTNNKGTDVLFWFQLPDVKTSERFRDLLTQNKDRLIRDLDAGCSKDYFGNYAKLVNQQHMLQDSHRTGTYYSAVFRNLDDFKEKVVMDVGAGTGVLSFFSAQAGARKVYAVEASEMAIFARRLAKSNGFQNVEVKHQTLETLEISEKVDTLISEPMGTLLINERMLETYVEARDRFLKPGGKMFPSKGTIYVAPVSDAGLHQEYCQYGAFWQQENFFGLDVRDLCEDALQQQFAKPAVDYFDPNSLVSESVSWECDFTTITIEELQHIEIPLCFESKRVAIVHGLGAWFDVDFLGSQDHVKLSTGPHDPPTHWRQMRMLFRTPIAVNPGQKLRGKLELKTNQYHSYDMDMELRLDDTVIATSAKNLDLRYPAYGPFAGSPYIPRIAPVVPDIATPVGQTSGPTLN